MSVGGILSLTWTTMSTPANLTPNECVHHPSVNFSRNILKYFFPSSQHRNRHESRRPFHPYLLRRLWLRHTTSRPPTFLSSKFILDMERKAISGYRWIEAARFEDAHDEAWSAIFRLPSDTRLATTVVFLFNPHSDTFSFCRSATPFASDNRVGERYTWPWSIRKPARHSRAVNRGSPPCLLPDIHPRTRSHSTTNQTGRSREVLCRRRRASFCWINYMQVLHFWYLANGRLTTHWQKTIQTLLMVDSPSKIGGSDICQIWMLHFTSEIRCSNSHESGL